MTHIALATCQDLPDHEHDDVRLHESIVRHGMRLSQPAWNDPDVDWASFDAVVIRTTWDYTEHLDDFLAWTRHVSACSRLFNSSDAVAWNSDKRYLMELERHGVPIVPTTWLDKGEMCELMAWAEAHRAHGRGFFKPVVGANARGTHRFSLDDAAAIAHAQRVLDGALEHGGVMLQPYRRSVESFGEVSLICFGGRISHAVRKVPVPGDYRVQDDWGARDEPLDWRGAHPELGILATQSIEAAEAILGEALLYARVDVLRAGSGDFELNELEIIEPSLFFRHGEGAEEALLEALAAAMQKG